MYNKLQEVEQKAKPNPAKTQLKADKCLLAKYIPGIWERKESGRATFIKFVTLNYVGPCP